MTSKLRPHKNLCSLCSAKVEFGQGAPACKCTLVIKQGYFFSPHWAQKNNSTTQIIIYQPNYENKINEKMLYDNLSSTNTIKVLVL